MDEQRAEDHRENLTDMICELIRIVKPMDQDLSQEAEEQLVEFATGSRMHLASSP